jgi:hypothetical protein
MLRSTYDRLYPGFVEISLKFDFDRVGYNISYLFPDSQIYTVWIPARNYNEG